MMFKKAVIIAGPGDIGKSTLIKLIRAELKNREAKENLIWESPTTPPIDFTSILEYKGKKILIISAGDHDDIIKTELSKVIKNGYSEAWLSKNIDFVLGAAKTYGETHSFWEKRISLPIIWLSKSKFEESEMIIKNQYLAKIYADTIEANM